MGIVWKILGEGRGSTLTRSGGGSQCAQGGTRCARDSSVRSSPGRDVPEQAHPRIVAWPRFLTLALALLLAFAACEPPDQPPALVGGLPTTAAAYLDPDRVSAFQLEEGVVYRSVRSGTKPWRVHLLEVDVGRCEVGFRVVRAAEEEGRIPVSEMARRSEPGVIAAVNGDFFTPEDLPLGVEVSEGVLRGRTSRPVFAWRPGYVPWVGPIEWDGDSIHLGTWATSQSRPAPDLQVVAGFPSLLTDGRTVGDLQQGERPEFAGERHPRTAIGFDPVRSRIWIAVVDGRREGVSEGMSLPELAGLFRALGVRNAINLDGGGSSVMVIRSEPVSRPSDPAGQRPVVNALVVRHDPTYCGAVNALDSTEPEVRVDAVPVAPDSESQGMVVQ